MNSIRQKRKQAITVEPFHKGQGAFTLLELIVVISIVGLLAAIMVPGLSRVKKYARSVINAGNQRQTACSIVVYGADHHNHCPESVATTGFGSYWNWAEPTKLISEFPRSSRHHRSMSAYLGGYLSQAEVMYCANSPRPPHKYLEKAWQDGDLWDNPDTLMPQDPLGGTFCYYWNYIGYLEKSSTPFKGPRSLSDSRPVSQLVVSDYFGFDHWRSPQAYGSCELFTGSQKVPETWLLSSYWAGPAGQDSPVPKISLRAAFLDGHVASYDSTDLRKMKVSLSVDGKVPYPDGIGPGIFYIPKE